VFFRDRRWPNAGLGEDPGYFCSRALCASSRSNVPVAPKSLCAKRRISRTICFARCASGSAFKVISPLVAGRTAWGVMQTWRER
jgi:hypothetical protein